MKITIDIPDGYMVDAENSTQDCIKLKPVNIISGWKIKPDSSIVLAATSVNHPESFSIFATQKQAESALAMAQISQIIANDSRFGGPITDNEWKNEEILKYIIDRIEGKIVKDAYVVSYYFLAFHTEFQRDLFLEKYESLVKQYLML